MPLFAHIGIGLAFKQIDPKRSTWLLVIGSMLLDILLVVPFIVLIIAGVSTTGASPLTHSLLGASIISGITFLVVYLIDHQKSENSNNLKTASIMTLLIFSHWLLDFIGWPMTLGGLNPSAGGIPITFDTSFTIGIGVYRTLTGAIIMEIGVFIIGFVLYRKAKVKS